MDNDGKLKDESERDGTRVFKELTNAFELKLENEDDPKGKFCEDIIAPVINHEDEPVFRKDSKVIETLWGNVKKGEKGARLLTSIWERTTGIKEKIKRVMNGKAKKARLGIRDGKDLLTEFVIQDVTGEEIKGRNELRRKMVAGSSILKRIRRFTCLTRSLPFDGSKERKQSVKK